MMARTLCLLTRALGRDLGQLANAYFQPRGNRPKDIAFAGAFEECVKLPIGKRANEQAIFRKACEGGHTKMVNALVKRGVNAWTAGALGAARGGHLELLASMKKRKHIAPATILIAACRGGQIDLAEQMLASPIRCAHRRYKRHRKGACIISTQRRLYFSSIRNAARGGHLDLLTRLQAKSYDPMWEMVLELAAQHGHLNIAHYALPYVTSQFSRDHALHVAITCNHVDIAKIIFASGTDPYLHAHFIVTQNPMHVRILLECGAIPCDCCRHYVVASTP